MWLLALLLSCSGPDRATPVTGPADPAVALSTGLPFAELEIPDASREQEPPEKVAVTGFEYLSTTGTIRNYRADLPVRLRTLFISVPPPNLEVLDAEGEVIPHLRQRTVGGVRWRFGLKALTLLKPSTDEAVPADGEYYVSYPPAARRERRLNYRFSGIEDKADFVRARAHEFLEDYAGLLVPAPGKAAFDLTVPHSGELHFRPGLVAPEVIDGPPSDGATFVVELDVDGKTHELWRKTLKEPSFEPVVLDLSAYGGKQARIRFRSEPGETTRFDYAFFADPVVAPRKANPKRVVMIFVDTLRPDHLGLYGYHRKTSDSLDELAKDAVVFDQARSVAPWTLPSSRSLVTGRYPERWRNSTTLQGELRERGWATAFFAGNTYLSDNFEGTRDWGYHHAINWPSAEDQIDRARAWLAAQDGRDALLMVHFMDTHLPYQEPAEYRHRYAGDARNGLGEEFHRWQILTTQVDAEGRDYVRDRYDNNVAYVHEELGRLLLDLKEDDVVVYFSDHGEEFWDHQRFEHGHSLFDEVIRVPMVLKAPGVKPGRVQEPVSLLDITPTLLDVLDIDGGEREGVSLMPAIRDEPGAREALSERDLAMGWLLYGTRRWGLMHDHEKWVVNEGREALFDVKADPQERDNRFLGEEGDYGVQWRDRLAKVLDRPVLPAYRLVSDTVSYFPEDDLIVEATVPGGIRHAWVADDPSKTSTAEVVYEGERLVARWPAGWRASREIFFVPNEPLEDTTHKLHLVAKQGSEEGLMAINSHRFPALDANRLPLARWRFKEPARQVMLGFAIVPLPDDKGTEVVGYDPELEKMLEAMGYAVGRDAPVLPE